MEDFSQQITNFTNYGTYAYRFDEVGNEILNPSSSIFQQVYFSLPLSDCIYDNTKILAFYAPEFTEFVPLQIETSSVFPQEAIDQINAITNQNIQLQSQLESLIASSEMNSGSVDIQSVKNTIMNLRIQLGQGETTNDFENEYPYLPIPSELKNPPTQ